MTRREMKQRIRELEKRVDDLERQVGPQPNWMFDTVPLDALVEPFTLADYLKRTGG